MKLLYALPILLAVAVLLPLGVIWSLNTLFSLSIAYTIKTWGACAFLMALTELMLLQLD